MEIYYCAGPFLQTQSGSFTQGVGQQARRSRIPMSGAAGCGVTLHHLTTLSSLPREHQRSIRRMWSVQDSVATPQGMVRSWRSLLVAITQWTPVAQDSPCGAAPPHISPNPQRAPQAFSPFFTEKNSLLHGDYHMKIDLIII